MDRPAPAQPDAHPAVLVAGAVAAYGEPAVAAWCADLLAGRRAPDDPRAPLLIWLAGGAAKWYLAQEMTVERGIDYWPRVWGARGLRYAWTPAAGTDIRTGLGDPHWRVREMCAHVAELRELGECGDALAGVAAGDGTPRARSAACRALGRVGEAEHAAAVRAALQDQDTRVRHTAAAALDLLRIRLDRDL
ncbi:MAG TPA: HEAT repeat domain-containing protein [Micromonosporaceae bacterium]|nr:HEAT repeat domain-containing protein [Micromonosporaceae bacterium]